jgi:hypothetical protein
MRRTLTARTVTDRFETPLHRLHRLNKIVKSLDMAELLISRATEDDRAAFLDSVNGLFHEDAGVNDPGGDPEWVARGGAVYFTDLLTDPQAVPLLARDGERSLGHLVGRMLAPDTLQPGTRVAVLESMRVAPQARGRGVGGYAASGAVVRCSVVTGRAGGAGRGRPGWPDSPVCDRAGARMPTDQRT